MVPPSELQTRISSSSDINNSQDLKNVFSGITPSELTDEVPATDLAITSSLAASPVPLLITEIALQIPVTTDDASKEELDMELSDHRSPVMHAQNITGAMTNSTSITAVDMDDAISDMDTTNTDDEASDMDISDSDLPKDIMDSNYDHDTLTTDLNREGQNPGSDDDSESESGGDDADELFAVEAGPSKPWKGLKRLKIFTDEAYKNKRRARALLRKVNRLAAENTDKKAEGWATLGFTKPSTEDKKNPLGHVAFVNSDVNRPSWDEWWVLPFTPQLNFLTAGDLTRCIRVCRQWQFIFRPILYRNFVSFFSSVSAHEPSLEVASRHGHFMQRLECFGEIEKDYLSIPSITHLTELVLSRGNDGLVFKATYWDAVTALVRRNSLLTKLRLSSGLWPPVSPAEDPDDASLRTTAIRRDHLWNAVQDHPNLKHLFIMNTRWISIQPYTPSFWHAISRLDSLSFIYCSLSQKDTPRFIPLPEGLSPKLKEFRQVSVAYTLEKSDHEQQLRFLSFCSKLERLLWSVPIDKGDDRIFPKTEFLRTISAGTWPSLSELSMPGLLLQDQDFAQIFDGLQQCCQGQDSSFSPTACPRSWTLKRTGLKKLTMGGSGFGSGALKSLAAHFSTLTALSLYGGREKTSLVMQRVLESCPCLISIDGDLLYASDMVHGKPWICCSTLDSFSIDIVLDLENDAFQKSGIAMGIPLGSTAPKSIQLFVYGQLARLTQLKRLALRSSFKDEEGADAKPLQRLDLDLEHGLGQLSTLSRLKQLDFRSVQKMTTREMEWMVVHWRKLEKITGEMNENIDKQYAMRAILQRHKITHYTSN
ncbi:hypothetical protein EMPS_03141 [Entomortierella parvispora]|uniref:F-box domain-containing protein n=1 Tax=Entomortierella parvispora TaxID=205924 RepID=A0A9P3H607_9FUNG|nr:hypothetical protein EMPS_03141 [Entomortierella parvispora]